MNQLVSKLIWYILSFLMFVQIPFIFLYSSGHLPELVCHVEAILAPTIMIGFLGILDSISVVRYLFIFHMKNPTANQDDFWSKFLFIWTFFASLIFNIAFFILPGKNGHFFYICVGHAPSSFLHAPTKWNPLMVFKGFSSILINGGVFLRCKMFKRIENSNRDFSQTRYLAKKNLPSATFCLAIICVVFIFFTFVARINKVDLDTATKYPGYLWLQTTNLSFVPIANFLYLVVILVKDNNLRSFVYRECKMLILEKIFFQKTPCTLNTA